VILTITPNAAVDKTYRVEGFALDRVNRPSQSSTVAGGKGINAARVYQTLGGKAVATGFLGGANGRIIAQSLAAECIRSEFVEVAGESRVCIAIIDPSTGSQTEINESGPAISPQNTRDLTDAFRELLAAQSFEFVLLCGSLPPGAPDTLYAELITIAHEYNVRSVLDASGDALRMGIKARPWMVKPNLAELEALFGAQLPNRVEQFAAVNELHARGIEVVALTLGGVGAIASARMSANDCTIMWESTPPIIEFASAVASGDSFIAAFLWSWNQTHESGEESISTRVEAALRLGTGAGAANAAEIGAGFCSKDSILAAAAKTLTTICRQIY
jgi:1-phosphofructokinase family hexose kinase